MISTYSNTNDTSSSECHSLSLHEAVVEEHPQDAADAIVERAREIIRNHPQLRCVGVNEIAKQLPVTRRTLDRHFAQTVGHTVLKEINKCRLRRAKQLLNETDLLIKRVAYLAGFPSRERMRLHFLREEGVSPSEYRERMRSEVGVR